MDPVYGSDPPDGPTPSIALGRLSPRGEKAVRTVPVETLMRIGWNPFLLYMLAPARRVDRPPRRGPTAESGRREATLGPDCSPPLAPPLKLRGPRLAHERRRRPRDGPTLNSAPVMVAGSWGSF